MTVGWRVHAKCIDGKVDQTLAAGDARMPISVTELARGAGRFRRNRQTG